MVWGGDESPGPNQTLPQQPFADPVLAFERDPSHPCSGACLSDDG